VSDSRLVVLVNGLPAAGKSTLAPPLARELHLPLLSKDVIKETHADVLGAEPPDERDQREWNAALGRAASHAMWALLASASGGAVLESSWRRDVRDLVAAGLASAGVGQPVEVWCDVPPALAWTRYVERRCADVRHRVGDDGQLRRAARARARTPDRHDRTCRRRSARGLVPQGHDDSTHLAFA
jgi:glucokinase